MKIYISLTSIFQNQNILLKTLKSIKEQTLKPNKCIIYLSEEPYLLDAGFKDKTINNELNIFLKENELFEIKWCKNIGPYRKLLPLLKEKLEEDCLIITIDDDTEYHPSLIENYVNDYKDKNCCISYRGFTMMKNNENKIDYDVRANLKNNNLFNFHTGKGGVLYHPKFFSKTKNIIFKRKIYTECCETGDDIWFNFMRIANGINCYIGQNPFMTKDFTDPTTALWFNFNNVNKLNTVNINKTIEKLIELNVLNQLIFISVNS